ncbi:MAG: TerB family tellurite resistance protein [Deltaproteobacteria bacterium]|nr:TerB family tellurite resistance protein [Deltaproteobacteria bacterium]
MVKLSREELKVILLFGIHIARIDGEIAPFERKMLARFADAMKLTPEDRGSLLTHKFSLAEGLRALQNTDAKQLLLKTLCAVAHCDGDTAEVEVDFINKVTEKMTTPVFILPRAEWGVYEEEVFQAIKAMS